MISRLYIVIFLFLILTSSSLDAQKKLQIFEVKKYGLSLEQPFHSAKNFSIDSMGRLLFFNYSFDGMKFKKRKDVLTNPIKIEKDGSQWKRKDQFTLIYITPDSTYEINTKEHFKYSLVNVEVDGNDKYLLTNLGIVHLRKEGENIRHIQNIPLKGEDSYNILLQGDTLYIKKLSEMSYILTTDVHREYSYIREKLSIYDNGIFYLKNERVCLKLDSGFKLFPSKHPYSKALKPSMDFSLRTYLFDSKKRLWISWKRKNQPGLYLLNNTASIEAVLFSEENISPYAIFEDMHESIWVGTGGHGIFQLYEPSIQVYGKKNGLTSNNIRSFIQNNKSEIFISAEKGIDIITQDNEIAHTKGIQFVPVIFFDSDDNLWSSEHGGIGLSKADGRYYNYTKKDGLMSSRINTIFQDSQNDIWVGTRKGVHVFKDNQFQAYPAPGIGEYDRVLAMREYKPNSFLIGFESGRVFKFKEGKYEELSFPATVLNTIYTDSWNNTWLCSENSGLYQFIDEKIVPVQGSNLPSSIKLVQEDFIGNLWGLCEQNQIFRLRIQDIIDEVKNPKIDYFGSDEGVPMLATNNKIQPNSALLDDGRVIFPNIYGAILINPELVDQSISSFRTEYFYQDSIINDKIILKYGQNDVSLKFNTINIAPNCKISYEYNMGSEWLPFSEENRLDINNLASGTQTIQLRGRPSNGNWHEVTPVVVYVPPLIYHYLLFWIAIFLILVAFYFLLIRWKTHTVNQRNKMLSETVSKQTAEIEAEKSQLAKALEKQKALTQELNMSQTTKNRMYAQISHEFKSPLQTIKSHLSKSDGYINGNDKDRIKGNIDNLLNISNKIMELSKAESGNLKLKKNWYNINGVIADQVELKQQLALEKDIRIEQISKFNKQYLEFDISLMQKVIGNLLSNAIKFSPQGGNIRIESVVSNNTQIIEITDQGPGIPSSEVENITLAYYQASNNTEDGTGIGLSLVKEILKLNDSKLEISSKLSKGSTFGFKLKRPKITQKEIIQKNINIAGLNSQLKTIIDPSKRIILAVDDSEDVLFFITQALSPKFYVITAKNGEEALGALKKIKPNAIISEFNMPIMNGIEFLKHVRKLPSFQIIPFLFLTGSSSEQTELQSIVAGADLILQKPIMEDILVTQVSQILRRQKNISASIKSSFVHNLLPTNIQNDDLLLMKELESIFLENISNGKLTSQEIANLVGIGEKTLRNRVKGITNKTVKVYFRNFRLEKAKLLLAEGYGTMGEVALATGFSSLSYFSKSYKAYFDTNQ